jgi:hypothetical protein
MVRIWSWTAVLLVLVASPGYAQICRGAPSFAGPPYQVGGMVAVTEGAQAYGGEFAVGGQYLFAGAGVSARHFDEVESASAEVSSRVGLEVRVSETRRIFFCPVGFVAFGTGPDAGAVDVSTFSVGAGGRVGVMVRDTDPLSIVPTFGVDAVRERIARESGGVEQDETDGYGLAALGVGFIVNRRFSITPEIGVPFSAADSDVIFTVRFAYGFGT